MRTTVDIEDEILAAARERAAQQRMTLSALVGDAVRAYLEATTTATSAPFVLLTDGTPGGHYPTPRQIADLLAADELEPYSRR